MSGYMTSYGFGVTVQRPFVDVVEHARVALAAEGFGILMEADLQATFQKKLAESTAPYVILGACSARDAFHALKLEADLGLLLPCNVIVRGTDDGKVSVAAVDPVAQLGITGRAELRPIAEAIRERLARAIAALERGA